MKIYSETSLRNFEFWSGAVDTVNELTTDDLDQLEYMLEDCGGEWSETEINDFFWFENDTIAEWLGYENWDDLVENRNAPDEIEDTEEEAA